MAKLLRPQVVTMSEEKRALVESALRSARQGRLELSEPSAASEGEADTSQPEMEEMLERLQEMGFRPDDATEAVEEVGPGKAADAYLDWLCLNVEEEHLPSRSSHILSPPCLLPFVTPHSPLRVLLGSLSPC